MLSKHQNNVVGGGNSPVNYNIIDPGEDKISIIQILEGKFRGVKFRIGKVGLVDDNGITKLKFTTDIMKKPWRLLFVDLKENDLFTDVAGNILIDLMQKNSQEYNKLLVG